MALATSLCTPITATSGGASGSEVITIGLCVQSGCNTLSCITKTTTYSVSDSGKKTTTVVYTDGSGAAIEVDREVTCPQKVEVINPSVAGAGVTIDGPLEVTGLAGGPVVVTGNVTATVTGDVNATIVGTADVNVTNPVTIATPAITLEGQNCDGAAVPQAGLFGQLVQAVQPVGQVYKVQLCSQPQAVIYDREPIILCAPDGTQVFVQNVTPEESPLGTAPVFEAYTLAGAPYAGDIGLLTTCLSPEKIDVSAEQFCSAGVGVTRTTFYDVSASPPVVLTTVWRDLLGAVIPEPAIATLIMGACVEACAVIETPFVVTSWAQLR